MNFHDVCHFVCQSGTASVVSCDVGKLNVVKTEGIFKNKHRKLLPNHAIFHLMESGNLCNTKPHVAHFSPAEYSAKVFGNIFCWNVACDVTKSVASHLAEYSAAV